MKITFTNVLIGILCVLLICGALCVGAVRGWSRERTQVISALTKQDDLRAQLEYRGMDAANLAVVAARHLPADDSGLMALRAASAVLLSVVDDTQAIIEADQTITTTALEMSSVLPSLASVQASSRDMTYVTMLTGTLGKDSGLMQAYTEVVEDYNHRLSTSLTGRLAMLLGVKPLPLPTAD